MTKSAAAPTSSLQLPMRLIPLALAFAVGVWAQNAGWIRAVSDLSGDLLFLTRRHLELVALSASAGILVGVALGIAVTRPGARRWSSAVVQIVNVVSSVPTLAKMALAMTLVGIGSPPAIIGLFVVTLLPVVGNTIAGLRNVPRHLIEAATGMGMTARQTLLEVELPNALFVILTGVRTALALNVGTAPLAFLLGATSLGELIFTGIALYDQKMLFIGAAATALLAIAVDLVAGLVQYWAVRRGVNPLR
jgi:osmoprotectant transport system permease protein